MDQRRVLVWNVIRLHSLTRGDFSSPPPPPPSSPSTGWGWRDEWHFTQGEASGCLSSTKSFLEIRLASKWNSTFRVVPVEKFRKQWMSEKVILFSQRECSKRKWAISELLQASVFEGTLCAKPLIGTWFFILMQIELTRKVLHLASFWKRKFLELGIGLLLQSPNLC